MIIASSADRAMTVREWDPVLQRSGDMVPFGPRSLTVTALLSGEGYFASSCQKHWPHLRNKFSN